MILLPTVTGSQQGKEEGNILLIIDNDPGTEMSVSQWAISVRAHVRGQKNIALSSSSGND